MKLQMLGAPHIKTQESVAMMMGDVVIALVPLYVMAVYYYGLRALVLGIVSIVTAYLCDLVCVLIGPAKVNAKDISAIVTGMLIPLMLPASVPYSIVVIGAAFAIIVIKHPFGGFGNNPFNPAAGAMCFMALCWPETVFQFPTPFDPLPLFGEVTNRVVNGSAGVLKLGGLPTINPMEMLLGNYPGPMGATCVLVVAMCLLFLIARRTISWQIPVSFILTAAAIAFLFPRISSGDRIGSVIFELLSGTLLFGAVFVVTDPVTSPKLRLSKTIYAILCAAILMMFRYYGAYQQGLGFAVVIMNAFSYVIDTLIIKIRYNNKTNKHWMQDDYENFMEQMRVLRPQLRSDVRRVSKRIAQQPEEQAEKAGDSNEC